MQWAVAVNRCCRMYSREEPVENGGAATGERYNVVNGVHWAFYSTKPTYWMEYSDEDGIIYSFPSLFFFFALRASISECQHLFRFAAATAAGLTVVSAPFSNSNVHFATIMTFTFIEHCHSDLADVIVLHILILILVTIIVAPLNSEYLSH